MAETFSEVLKSFREASGMSLAALAAHTHHSKSELGHIETGIRKPFRALAEACDEALGTSPLLVTLWELDGQGDTMERRTLLGMISSAMVVGPLAVALVADQVSNNILDAIGEEQDWDAIVADFTRRMVVDPSDIYGTSLLAQLTTAKGQIIEYGPKPDLVRAAAELHHLYGLWLGNNNDVASARGWHRTAIRLADRSTHTPTAVYIRGRAASRQIYEGSTVRETVDLAGQALGLSSRPSVGGVEAYSALVHVHGLAGNLSEGRTAVIGMRNVVDRLPGDVAGQIAGSAQKTASFHSYLECRLGTWADAQRAFDEAQEALRSAPLWLADAKLYFGRAMVTAGDVAGGIDYTLAAIKSVASANVRTIRTGVSDVISVVPASYRSDSLRELRTYAATGPMPWETLA